MKKLVLLSFAVAAALCAAAQNAPLGKRLPDIKPKVWLDGVLPAQNARITCLEFYHPKSSRSRQNIAHLKELAAAAGGDVRIIVIAGGDERTAADSLRRYIGGGTAVAIDEANRYFEMFDVAYLPACIIVDDHGRAIWVGDSGQLTTERIRELKDQR